jgi:hypothetical protein
MKTTLDSAYSSEGENNFDEGTAIQDGNFEDKCGGDRKTKIGLK